MKRKYIFAIGQSVQTKFELDYRRTGGQFPRINCETSELVMSLLPWQRRGLQQTSTGYGAKLTSSFKINFNGKLRRLYHTCYGNASSCWFITKGRKIFVN